MKLIEILIIFLIISLITSRKHKTKDCNEMATNEKCQFYSQCLEPKFHCGASGYPLGYGYRYCSKFLNYLDYFTESGQKWVKKVLVCLKKSLNKPFDNCANLLNTAFDSHPECYVQSGLCELFQESIEKVTQNLIGLYNVYEVKDFQSLSTLNQVFITAKRCGGNYYEQIKNFFWDKITNQVPFA